MNKWICVRTEIRQRIVANLSFLKIFFHYAKEFVISICEGENLENLIYRIRHKNMVFLNQPQILHFTNNWVSCCVSHMAINYCPFSNNWDLFHIYDCNNVVCLLVLTLSSLISSQELSFNQSEVNKKTSTI